MGIRPSVGSGALMSDELLGAAFHIVKHVDDHLEEITAVAAITEHVTRVGNDLGEVEGSILQGTLAIVLAGVTNFRSTFAEAITEFPVGAYFTSAASGELRLYRRTAGGTGYTDQGDIVAPVSRALLEATTGAALIGTTDGTVQEALDARPTSSFLNSDAGAASVRTSRDQTVEQELSERPTSEALLLGGGAAAVGQAVIPEAVTVAEALAALVPAFVPEEDLLDATNEINTGIKFPGRQAVSLPSGIMFYAQGIHPTTGWVSQNGEITLNPVVE